MRSGNNCKSPLAAAVAAPGPPPAWRPAFDGLAAQPGFYSALCLGTRLQTRSSATKQVASTPKTAGLALGVSPTAQLVKPPTVGANTNWGAPQLFSPDSAFQYNLSGEAMYFKLLDGLPGANRLSTGCKLFLSTPALRSQTVKR